MVIVGERVKDIVGEGVAVGEGVKGVAVGEGVETLYRLALSISSTFNPLPCKSQVAMPRFWLM